MTTTTAKIEANRRNARFSTGPRSPEGKAISARNALRHGMRAEKYLVEGEEDEFESVLQDLRDYYEPATALEERLVFSIARCYLRLDRVARGEAEVIADAPLEQFFGREQQTAKTLLHYETVIRKTMHQEVEALARMQRRRKKNADDHRFTNEPKRPINQVDTRLDAAKSRFHPLIPTLVSRDRPDFTNEAKFNPVRTVIHPGDFKPRLHSPAARKPDTTTPK